MTVPVVGVLVPVVIRLAGLSSSLLFQYPESADGRHLRGVDPVSYTHLDVYKRQMYVLGYSLDNLSLLALTLAVGFVVDDAIVMLENIVRHLEACETPFEAAIKGCLLYTSRCV